MNLRLLKFIRMLHLIDKKTYNKKRHILLIKNSPYFDEAYYKNQFSDADFVNISPAEHYLTIGYKEGANPSPYFSTQSYLEENPDVKAAGINPLLHYEISGKNEGRYRQMSLAKLYCSYGHFYNFLRKIGQYIYRKDIQTFKNSRILVHLHLYYTSSWIEIKEYLTNLLPYHFDLIVTYTELSNVTYTELSKKTDFITDIKKFKSDAKILPYANKGFDLGPFIDVLKDIKLEDYDIVYHIHSKSIAGKKGRIAYNKLFKKKSWFTQLYSGCLGVFNVHKGIKVLSEENNFGLIGAGNLFVKDMPKRTDSVKKYAAIYNLNIPDNYEFLIGSCFGMRAKLLSSIKNLHLELDDFHDSQRSIFTLAHALERIFATEVINAGYQFYKLPVLHNNHPITIFISNLSKKIYAQKVINQLKKHNLDNIEMLDLEIKSGLKCMFLKGTYKGHPVFIKYGGVEEIAQNEAAMQQMMHTIMPNHVPSLYLYNQNPVFIVMSLISGRNLEEMLNFGITYAEQQDILRQLDEIKVTLTQHNFVHRDIQPANLIYANNQLYLIDYQFMVKKNNDGSLNELNYVLENTSIRDALGGIYRYSPADWDDGYSIDLIKEKVCSILFSSKEKKIA